MSELTVPTTGLLPCADSADGWRAQTGADAAANAAEPLSGKVRGHARTACADRSVPPTPPPVPSAGLRAGVGILRTLPAALAPLAMDNRSEQKGWRITLPNTRAFEEGAPTQPLHWTTFEDVRRR